MVYFMIYNSDGDTRVLSLSREEVLERLNPEDEEDRQQFYDSFPGERDPAYWGKTLIIKGEVVHPEPEEVIIKWGLP